MNSRLRSYTAYSIGVAVVWGVLLLLAWMLDPSRRFDSIVLVFFGFAIGWLSATIARVVYPPPRKHRERAEPTP
jgi:hypothetical protein